MYILLKRTKRSISSLRLRWLTHKYLNDTTISDTIILWKILCQKCSSQLMLWLSGLSLIGWILTATRNSAIAERPDDATCCWVFWL